MEPTTTTTRHPVGALAVIGTNVRYGLASATVILQIDLAQRNGLSGSGKTTIIGKTRGNVALAGLDMVFLGLSCYTKNPHLQVPPTTMPETALGQGITARIEDTILTVAFDGAARRGPSSTGKTTIVATTNGNLVLPAVSEVYLGLTAYAK